MSRPILVATLALFAPLAAQRLAAQPASYLNIVTIEVERGQQSAFEEHERRINEARASVGEPNGAGVHRVRVGGTLNRYHIVRPFNEPAEMERWMLLGELLTTAFGEREAARVLELGAASVRSVSRELHLYEPDLSSNVGCASAARFVHVVTTRIDAARMAEHTAALESLARAEERAGFCRTRRTVRVGSLFHVSAVHSADSMAQLLSGPGPVELLREAYGEELGRSIWDRANAAVLERSIEIVERIPELSYTVE